MDTVAAPCHLVVVPYPGRSHINAMLNLCRLLAARDGVSATFVITEEWLGLLGGEPLPARVRFETIPNVVPSEHGRASDMAGFFEAVNTKMEAPFERLVNRVAPAAIVADTFLPWAVLVGNRSGVPVCILSPLSAAMLTVHYHFHRLVLPADASATDDGSDSFLIRNYIPGLKSIRLTDLEPTHSNKTPMRDLILGSYAHVRKAQCVIFTSFHELESNTIGSLKRDLPYPVFSVGPCIPFMALQQHTASTLTQDDNQEEEEKQGGSYMAWLDAQPANSVLYVSLGSFLSVSSAQLDEIAIGLAQSNVRFLWVLRDACSHDVQDLVRGSDCVIIPWCDQLKVLCHPSVGGFFTHCGMNSTLEALYAGVPMLALPIALDQPINCRLIVDEWMVVYNLKEKIRPDGIIGRVEISEAVKRLMNCGDGEGIRMRASMMKDVSRGATEVGGSSYNDITSFIDYISQLNNQIVRN